MRLAEFAAALSGPVAVVFGNEVSGVGEAALVLCDGSVEIPQWGMKHSLNVSIAAGIVLWELVRRRMEVMDVSKTADSGAITKRL
jgi:tRNA G18 (ribose-2'-O)-methylase SpoU